MSLPGTDTRAPRPPAGPAPGRRPEGKGGSGAAFLLFLLPAACCGGPFIIAALAAASAAALGIAGGITGAVLVAAAVAGWVRRPRRAAACGPLEAPVRARGERW